MSRRRFWVGLGQAAGAAALVSTTADGVVKNSSPEPLGPRNAAGEVGPLIHVPANPEHWPEWRRQLTAWRDAAQRVLAYDDALYRRDDLQWAAHCFCCGFAMLCDEAFYDRPTGRFSVEQFLEDGQRRFGGYDAIVLCHAYPRIGCRRPPKHDRNHATPVWPDHFHDQSD